MLLDMLKAFTPKSFSFQLFHADKKLLRSGVFFVIFLIGIHSNKRYEVTRKRSTKKKSLQKEPTVNRRLLILDLKPLKSQVKGKHSIGRDVRCLATLRIESTIINIDSNITYNIIRNDQEALIGYSCEDFQSRTTRSRLLLRKK